MAALETLALHMPELLEHHVLPHLTPVDLAALLAASQTLYAWALRQRLWAYYKRHCITAQCCGCGRAPPLTDDAVIVRFDKDRENESPCTMAVSGQCWFSHQPNETWVFCTEACFREHTTPDPGPSDGGLHFDCKYRLAIGWNDDWWYECQAPFSLPAWPYRVRAAPDPALTLEGMLPDVFEHHVLPHLGPEDLMRWLMTTRGRWAERHVWWERFLARSVAKPRCLQCNDRPRPRHTLQCVRVDEDLHCPRCDQTQSGFERGDHVYLHTGGCAWSSSLNVSYDAPRDICILENWPCGDCRRKMSNVPVRPWDLPSVRVTATLISPLDPDA